MQKVPQKHARTCKKLPVASFCASETAETGRIANGREQGDHVSRRQESYKVFLPYFLYFTKSRKKLLLGRAKSCRWQVFVRRRPPKQGELRTDVSKATMFQGDRGLRPSGLPGTIQSSVGEDFSKVFRRHEPKPVFRTKRRRKGFESVRGSGVTA